MDPASAAFLDWLKSNTPTLAAILMVGFMLRPYILPLGLWVKDRVEARAARELKRDAWIEQLVKEFRADMAAERERSATEQAATRKEFTDALDKVRAAVERLAAAVHGGSPNA